jgi:secreted trypsin-like serine protease
LIYTRRLVEVGSSSSPEAGWGLTAEGAQVANVLRQVTVQLVSNKVCNGLGSYSGAITDRMICAGFPEGGRDSCQGDSSGPLIVPDRMGGYVQAGIVSFGEGCGRPNKFGVDSNVSTIAPWVAGKIGTVQDWQRE